MSLNVDVNELIGKLDKSKIYCIALTLAIILNLLYFSSDKFLKLLSLDLFVSKYELYIPISTLVIDLILIIVYKLIQYILKNYKRIKVI